MKVFTTYDDSGHIVGVAIAAADVKDDEFAVIAEPGHHASVIEVPAKGRKQPHEIIADLIKNFRVQGPAHAPTFQRIKPPVVDRKKSRR